MVRAYISQQEKSLRILAERELTRRHARFLQAVEQAKTDLRPGETGRVYAKLLRRLATDFPKDEKHVETWVENLVKEGFLSADDRFEAIEALRRPVIGELRVNPLLSDLAFYDACEDKKKEFGDQHRGEKIDRLRALHEAMPLPDFGDVDEWLAEHQRAGRLTEEDIRQHIYLDIGNAVADVAHDYLSDYLLWGREQAREKRLREIALQEREKRSIRTERGNGLS